jgi:hypothetical protein
MIKKNAQSKEDKLVKKIVGLLKGFNGHEVRELLYKIRNESEKKSIVS